MNRNEAKKIAAENGCELFNWRSGSMWGWTLWEIDGDSDGLQIDYSTAQLKDLTPEALLSDCKRITA